MMRKPAPIRELLIIGGVTENRKGHETAVSDLWSLDLGADTTRRGNRRVASHLSCLPCVCRCCRRQADVAAPADVGSVPGPLRPHGHSHRPTHLRRGRRDHHLRRLHRSGTACRLNLVGARRSEGLTGAVCGGGLGAAVCRPGAAAPLGLGAGAGHGARHRLARLDAHGGQPLQYVYTLNPA